MSDAPVEIRDGLTYYEISAQPYPNCKISAGVVEGHPVEQVYFRMEKGGVITTDLLLTVDELAAMAWVANGTVWSFLIGVKEGVGYSKWERGQREANDA